MRTKVYGLDPPTSFLDSTDHPFMDNGKAFLRYQSPVDRRLIGNKDYGISIIGEQPDRLQATREELEFRPGLDMVRTIPVDYPVPVQEYNLQLPRPFSVKCILLFVYPASYMVGDNFRLVSLAFYVLMLPKQSFCQEDSGFRDLISPCLL